VRQGAVLVLFFPADNNSPAGNDWATVLTVRATHLSSHAGQVSFPGGRCDLGETAEQAALREYREELGEPGDLIVVGSLPPIHVFASNFHVTPVIAVVQKRPRFAPHAGEVAAVLEVPLSCLFDVNLRGAHEIVRGPLHFRTPHFEYGGHRVWGATWIILGDLLNRLHQTND
jgi:8-oxo-dGTP pyrophosphatase MutT (NUDIX family)